MNITRTAKIVNGKLVYDVPPTESELAADAARFAGMLQARQAPGTANTDRAFLEGQHSCGFDTEPDWFKEMVHSKAKAAGVNTVGKKYVGQLADERGIADPLAWVSGLDDVKAVVKERNLNCPNLGIQGEPTPAVDIPLAEKHIESIDRDYAIQDPNWKKKKKQYRREAIIDAHGAPAAGKGKRKATS